MANEVDGRIKLGVDLTVENIQKTARDLQKQVSDIFKSTDTSKLDAKTKNIMKTLSKLTSQSKILADEMDRFANEKIPTDRYRAVQKNIEQIKQEQEDLIEKQRVFIRAGGSENAKLYQSWTTELKKLDVQLAKAEERARKLEASGQGYTLGKDTQQYKDMTMKLNDMSNAIQVYKTKLKDAGISNVSFGQSLKMLPGIMGRGFIQLLQKIPIAIKGIASAARTAAGYVARLAGGLLKIAGAAIRKGFQHIASRVKGMATSFKSFHKTSGGGLKNLMKYILGIGSLLVVLNKLRAAIKEGINNMVKWRDGNNSANKSMTELTSSLLYLKNALAAAFVPILNVIAPILSRFIDMVAEAANTVGMFIAKLTGQNAFVKAKKVMKDYAESLGGVNDKLGEYDKLSVIGDDDKNSSDIANMFEEVPISAQVNDWIQKFKEAWANADFSELGALIGQKLKDALDGIPWDVIKEFARKVALSIGTFINGFIETEGLAESIGRTLGEAINTAVLFLDTLLDTIHWDSVGKFFADGLTSMIETIDWNAVGDLLATAINAWSETIVSFEENVDWYKLASDITEGLNTAIDNIDWEMLGTALGARIDLLAKAIAGFVDNFDFDNLGQKLGEGFTSLQNKIPWETIGHDLAQGLNGAFDILGGFADKWNGGDLGKKIANGINTALSDFKWKDNAQKLSKFLIDLLDALVTLLEDIDWYGFGKGVADFIANIDWASLSDRVFEGMGAILGGLAAFLWGLIEDAWNSVVEWWRGLAEEDGSYTAEGILEGIWQVFKNVGQWIVDHIFLPLWNGIKKAFKIQSPSKEMIALAKMIGQGILDGLAAPFKNIYNWIKTNIFEPLVRPFKSLFGIGSSGTSPSMIFKSYGSAIMGGLEQGFQSMVDSIIRIWNGLWDGIKGVINIILQGVFGFINNIIDGINFLIDKLNSFQLDVPEGLKTVIEYATPFSVPNSIGFNIGRLSNIQVPQLAQGAVIPPNNSFLAMLGDQKSGTNIEAPLQTMVDAFRQALNEDGGNRSPIVLQLDGKTVAQVVWDETDKKYKQTGQYIPRYA